jgi:hypothetical protein
LLTTKTFEISAKVKRCSKGFSLGKVGGVQALVGRQQQLEVLAGLSHEILRMRQQCVLSFDELPIPC